MAFVIPTVVKAQVKKIVSEELLRLAADKGPGLLEKGVQGIANFSKRKKGDLSFEEKQESLYALVTLLKEEQDEQEKEIENLKEALTEQGRTLLALERATEGLSKKVRLWQAVSIGAGIISIVAVVLAVLLK